VKIYKNPKISQIFGNTFSKITKILKNPQESQFFQYCRGGQIQQYFPTTPKNPKNPLLFPKILKTPLKILKFQKILKTLG
jgi:hypothetical protein